MTFKNLKISYGLTVCDEYDEIQNLFNYLIKYIDHSDEIIIVYDKNRISDNTLSLLKSFNRTNYSYHPFDFKENFLENKNYMNSLCTGDFIFQLDADEIPEQYLLENIKELLFINAVDVILTPRKNQVAGMTVELANQLGFHLTDNKYINWPDYQKRIYRNDPKIKWTGHPVHGMVSGYKTYAVLPSDYLFAIIHNKNLDRQIAQLNRYDKIQKTL